jgi:hypothetical protein
LGITFATGGLICFSEPQFVSVSHAANITNIAAA